MVTAEDLRISRAARKRSAAERALTLIESGMVVGLGAGTTAAYALEPLAMRVRTGAGRDVACVPCSSEVGGERGRSA